MRGAGLALGVLLLAGCTASAPASTASGAPSGGASPSSVATASGLPALADLTVSADGLGDLRVGEKVPSGTIFATWDAAGCQSEDTGSTGAWVAPYPKAADDYFGAYDIVVPSHAKGGTVTEIDVWSREMSTAEGISPGSTLEELRAAYPRLERVANDGLSDSYSVDGTTSRLVFEVATLDPSLPDYWSNGEVGHVLWIRVVPLAGTVHGLAASSAGACA